MNLIKQIALIGMALVVALLGFALMPRQSAHAQSFLPNWYLGTVSGLTNTIGTNDNITVNLGNSVPLFNGPGGIEFGFVASGAASGSVILSFARSWDNATWETSPLLTVTATANGTTPVIWRTNWTAGSVGAPYIKLVRLNNAANAARLTNFTLRVPSAPN